MSEIFDSPAQQGDTRVLIYSSTEEGRYRIRQSLPFKEASIDYVSSLEEAQKFLSSRAYSSLVADFSRLDYIGRELMLWAQTHSPETTVYYLSRSATPDVAAEVWTIDLNGMFRHKGYEHDILTPLLNTLFTEHPSNSWVTKISGEFMKIRRKLNNSRMGIILLIGAAGTGKYALTQIAHFRSTREHRPFVFLNCKFHGKMDAVRWSEKELELFRINIRNIMTAANGGTLYFHEIDHLPINVQHEIANILGMPLVRSANGRNLERFTGLVVCSTRHNLEEFVRVNEFDDDLFLRISENVIRIPSLSDNTAEIGHIAEEFLHNYCIIKMLPVKSFKKDALGLISGHVWGRNIRELFETIAHTVDLCDGRIIPPENILFEKPRHSSDETQNKRCRLKEALLAAKGNKSKAATALDISRKTLYEWIAEFGLGTSFGKPKQSSSPPPKRKK